jgi:hypothetical protein
MNPLCLNDPLSADISVAPLEESKALSIKYNYSFFALGYEHRCINIANQMKSTEKGQSIAFQFKNDRNTDFQKKIQWYKDNSINIVELENIIIEDFLFELFKNEVPKQKLNIFLDISSFTRVHIASFLYAFNQITLIQDQYFSITLGYSVARYSDTLSDGPIVQAGPVTPELAGWPKGPNLPSECIIGLGCEEGKALGVIEYIEPNSTWLFKPLGNDKKFTDALNTANDQLYSFSAQMKTIEYEINKPYKTFRSLESLVSSYLDSSRPILIPLGPKIFFAVSVLVALRNLPNVSVWRVSAGDNSAICQHRASGENIFLKVDFFM